MAKRVLLLGGTGAMGIYLAPELLAKGFLVDITTRTSRTSDDKNLRYLQGNAQDLTFLQEILEKEKYDVIVDFMVYTTSEFKIRYELLLKSCIQYIFLSSYRVFSNVKIITENSPRLLDASRDKEYLGTDDYALLKARQEDILKASDKKNWTIVRPAITYSRERFQLGTLEIDTLVWRTLEGVPVVLPKAMLSKVTTMTWAGDVARLISKLVLNKKAYAEDFNVSTSEYHTWQEVADIYKELIGLKLQTTSIKKYVNALGGGHVKYQVGYDRMFDRILDNSKILAVTGEKQESLKTLKDGLNYELTRFLKLKKFDPIDYSQQARFDKLAHVSIDINALNQNDQDAYLSVEDNRITKAVTFLKTSSSVSDFISRLKQLVKIRTRIRNLKTKVRLRTRLKDLKSKLRHWNAQTKLRNIHGATITLNGYFNYGNIIQRYALQKFLLKQGYKFVSYACEPIELNHQEAKRYHNTAEFIRRRILRIPFNENYRLPIYIVGSDQVWRNWGYADAKSELGYFFLDFLKDSKAKRIAYAASFGQSNLKDAMIERDFIDYARPLVDRFDAISVRESSAVEIMKNTWDVDVQQVVDPTMLLTADDYSQLINRPTRRLYSVEQIFSYILGVSDEKTMIVDKIANETKMKVSGVNLLEIEILPPVEQWLKSFRDAELVITDSFHGVVFSIINNTPFIVIDNDNGGVARITSLLEQFGLKDRLVLEKDAEGIKYSNFSAINWDEVNKKLEKYRASGANWLLAAVRK